MATLEERQELFIRLYTTNGAAIRGFVRSLVPTREDASDVMQDVAVVLWRKFTTVDVDDFRRWAFGVARLQVLAWRRDKARDRHLFRSDIIELLADLSDDAVDGALGEFASLADDAAEVPVRIRTAHLLPRIAPRLAVAACVAAAGIATWVILPRPVSLSPDTVTRIEVVDATRGSDYSPGQLLGEPRVSIEQGRMTLQLDGGPTLDLSAPADIEVVNGMHVHLHGGDVTVDVGDQVTGFIVDTTAARVVDLGTRFAVSVGGTGETDVVVLEGEIEVREPLGSARVSPYENLMAGEALTVAASNIARRLTAVTMEPRVTRLNRSGQLGVVTGVSDNVTDPDYRRFYGLVPGGMRNDALAYTTIGRARWRPIAGQEFPAELLGADTVRTFHDDRDSWDLEISLQIARPSTVYVMFDARNPVADWLRQDFTDTGLQVRTGPWREVGIVEGMAPHADGGLYVTYRVWKRDVLSACVVNLGPPRTFGQPGNRAMYGIAVNPL